MTTMAMQLWGQESTHQGFCPQAFGSPCLKEGFAEENGHRFPSTDSSPPELGLMDDQKSGGSAKTGVRPLLRL